LTDVNAAIRGVVRVESARTSGSGFFIDDSRIVTNHHVVGSSRAVELQMADGSIAAGRVVGVSSDLDLAIVESDISAPEVLSWANAATALSGSTAYGIGFPLGTSGSPVLTRGIVSRVATFDDGVRYVQTDAALNPGNSGGPLVDECGKVLGVITLKFAEGFSLAISASEARPEVARVMEAGPEAVPDQFVFGTAEEAVAYALSTLGGDAEYSGPCLGNKSVRTHCSHLMARTDDLLFFGAGMVGSSFPSGTAVVRELDAGYRLLGWDWVASFVGDVFVVFGVRDCLNVRTSPGLAGASLDCLPARSGLSLTGEAAWENGYVWVRSTSGFWLAARWLCAPGNCYIPHVGDSTHVFSE